MDETEEFFFTPQIKESLNFIFWTQYLTFGSCRVHRLNKSITWHFQVTLIFMKSAAGLKELWTVVLPARHVLVTENQKAKLLYSWRFSGYSTPIYWLVHGHMTSHNEIVYRQRPWAGNIAKTMTSNGKQFTISREILIVVARDQSVQLKVVWCCRWNLSVCCYITNHLMTGPFGNSESCLSRISIFPSTSRKTLRFSGNEIHCSPWNQSWSVNCCTGVSAWKLTRH